MKCQNNTKGRSETENHFSRHHVDIMYLRNTPAIICFFGLGAELLHADIQPSHILHLNSAEPDHEPFGGGAIRGDLCGVRHG